MIRLDAATVLLQWAVGGLLFLWVTTRRREVSLGYGWLLRGTYLLHGGGRLVTGLRYGEDGPGPRRAPASAVVLAAAGRAGCLGAPTQGRRVRRPRRCVEQRSARVAAMTGIERSRAARDATLPEFPPVLDLIAPAIGLVGPGGGGHRRRRPGAAVGRARWWSAPRSSGPSPTPCSSATGTSCSRACPRGPLLELIRWLGAIWPLRGGWCSSGRRAWCSVINGSIDDGYNGLLGWFWIACAVTTIVLVGVTRAALKERQYSAVMAATGLLYLAILTAFGTDLVARAVLS